MSPTVQSVLDSPPVRLGRPEVVAGRAGLGRAVRWVHVTDVRDVHDLLGGEELVLSTGLAIGESADDNRTYLRDLVRAGASGLVVELSVRLPRLPDVMVEAAEEAGFPLVVLHNRIRFVSVTELIHREIVAAQYDDLRRAQRIHEAFTTLSLEGATARTIVETTSTISGTSIVLEDLNRRVLAHTSVGRSDAELLRDWRTRSRLVPAPSATAVAEESGWLTTPVGLHDQLWARLVAPDPGPDPLHLAMLLERAAQALQIGRMAERDRVGVEFQAQSGFLNDVIRGGVETEADAVARARAFGLEPGRTHVPIIVLFPATDLPDPVQSQRQLQRFVESVSDAIGDARLSAVVGAVEKGSVGVILSVPSGRDEEKVVQHLSDALHSRLSDETGLAMTIGVEDEAPGILVCGPGLRRAHHIAKVAAQSRGPKRPYYRHADVRLLGLIALLQEDPRVQAFTESELQHVLVHDARHGEDLLGLLRSFLEVGGNKSTLARKVGRSRPAVYKQLDRLERILGLPLDDAASRTSLSVALLAHDQSQLS